MDLPPLACNGCTRCCDGEIELLSDGDSRLNGAPGDDLDAYETVRRGDLTFLKRVNGRCVYLGEGGCTIQASKPHVCRIYDCRQHAIWISEGPPALQAVRLQMASVQQGVRKLSELGVALKFEGADHG